MLEGVESRGIAGVGLQGVLTRGGSRCRFHYNSEVWVSADCVGNAAVDIVPALSPSQSLAGCLSLSLLSFSLSLSHSRAPSSLPFWRRRKKLQHMKASMSVKKKNV